MNDMIRKRTATWRGDRRSAVAVLFGIMAAPLVGMVGLAIDYAIWNQTYASMSLAASGAALNAVKIAANGELKNDPNFPAEGQAAGIAWFEAQIGRAANAARLINITPNVAISTGAPTSASVSATVSYSGTVTPIFGGLFGIKTYPISLQATATLPSSPFLNVEILLDNSPSMEIGATYADIYAMQMATPCNQYGAVYDAMATPPNPHSPSGQSYNDYQCTGMAGSYDGALACPIKPNAAYKYWPTTAANGKPTSAAGGQVCTNLISLAPPNDPPEAGAPCAFACHFDTTKPAGTGNDYYALARSTIPQTPCYKVGYPNSNCQITLRFDLVKQAVDDVIGAMSQDNVPTLNNLNVGVFTFDTTVHPVYPQQPQCGSAANSLACQAGNDWSQAAGLVGAPPTRKNTADTGIQPYGGGNVASTNFSAAIGTLQATYLTPSGSGASASDPAKVLFLVTDGLADYTSANGTRVNSPFSVDDCNYFKNTLGYTIYIVYTPYYPLMNAFYLNTTLPIAEGTGAGTVYGNLLACASSPDNFIQANPGDTKSIDAALQTFLIAALNTPARFTQ